MIPYTVFSFVLNILSEETSNVRVVIEGFWNHFACIFSRYFDTVMICHIILYYKAHKERFLCTFLFVK